MRPFVHPFRRGSLPVIGMLALSFVACSIITARTPGRFGDLIDHHTDHLHHVRATWTFLHRGLDVYRVPFGDIAKTVPYPHDGVTWPAFPIAYPVGMFALFLPPTLLGAWVPMSLAALGKLTIIWLLAITHAALFAIWLTMRDRPGGRIPLLVGIWILLLRSSMCGFYDAAWLGCAAMSVYSLARRRSIESLVWFTAAALVSYRAAALLPLGAFAAFRLLRDGSSVKTKLLTLASVGAVGSFCVYTFALMTKHSPPPESAVYEALKSPLLPFGLDATLVLAAGGVVAAALLPSEGALLSVSVLWSSLLAVYHAGHSWHGTILFVPAMLVGAVRPSLTPSFSRGVLVVWLFALWSTYFQHAPFVWVKEVLAVVERVR